LEPGTTVVVLATDPAAEHDVPAWARMRGHEVAGVERSPDGELRLSVVLG
jgi:tRNA 2-thiouridine synthesizing protein A